MEKNNAPTTRPKSGRSTDGLNNHTSSNGSADGGTVTRQQRIKQEQLDDAPSSAAQRHKQPASTRSSKLKNVENNSPPSTTKALTRRSWEEHQQTVELTCQRSKLQHNIQARRSRAYKRQQRMSEAASTGDNDGANHTLSGVCWDTCGCESVWESSRVDMSNRVVLKKLHRPHNKP